MVIRSIPLVRASSIQGFVTFLEEVGALTPCLLAEAKLPAAALRDPEALLPLKQALAFCEHAACTSGFEHLGLLVGQKTQLDALGAFGRLLRQSLTLQDAIHIAIDMMATYNSGERLWLLEQRDQVWLCRDWIGEPHVSSQQAEHYSVMIMINFLRLAAGAQWQPTEVHFKTGWTFGLNEVEPLANAEILFNQEATALMFPRSFLSLPLGHPDKQRNVQRYQDYQTLHLSAPATTFPGTLRQLIETLLGEGPPDIQRVAEMVGISVRSFQRYLSEVGLTYSYLVEQARLDRSRRLLSDSSIKIATIATNLGYTDAANFTRAFKRWTGLSPRQFRRLHGKFCNIGWTIANGMDCDHVRARGELI